MIFFALFFPFWIELQQPSSDTIGLEFPLCLGYKNFFQYGTCQKYDARYIADELPKQKFQSLSDN